jgi:hypothetical protein
MNTSGPGRGCAATPRPRPRSPSIGRVLAATATIAGILAANGCTRTPPAGSAQPEAVQPYVCPAGHGTCQGPLAAGTYRTDSFQPAIVYSVTDGWINTEDLDGRFRLTRVHHRRPVSTSESFIAIYRDGFPEAAACTQPSTAGGNSGTEMFNRWLHNPAVTATQPTAVNVGGLSGHMLTITRSPSASDDCPRPRGSTSSPLGGTKMLYLLTAGAATIIIDVTHAPGRDTVDQYRQLTDPVINSLAIFPPRAPDPPAIASSA